jgi:carbonic anhydrase
VRAHPAKRLAVVCCMDARIDPLAVLELRLGDAHVIRNAGGIVTDDTIRSLAISQRKLGTEEVVVIHHTRCGMHGLDDDEFRRELEEASGTRPEWSPGGFADLEEAVRESVARVVASAFTKDSVRGYVLDIETGELREID